MTFITSSNVFVLLLPASVFMCFPSLSICPGFSVHRPHPALPRLSWCHGSHWWTCLAVELSNTGNESVDGGSNYMLEKMVFRNVSWLHMLAFLPELAKDLVARFQTRPTPWLQIPRQEKELLFGVKYSPFSINITFFGPKKTKKEPSLKCLRNRKAEGGNSAAHFSPSTRQASQPQGKQVNHSR